MDTKALRQKILDLAIRGQLVPQAPNDEPASVLLDRIRAEKQKMVKEGKLKAKDIKNDSVIFVGEDNLHYEKFADGSVKCIENEIPFDLPERWEWVRLQSICSMSNGVAKRNGSDGTGTIVLRLADLGEREISFSDTRSVILTDDEIRKYALFVGDVLFIRVNGSKENVGKSFYFDNESFPVAYCDHLIRCTPTGVLRGKLLSMFMRCGYVRQLIDERMVSAAGQNTISQPSLATILLPVPPLKEQDRISHRLNNADNYISQIYNSKQRLADLVLHTKAKILDLAIRGQLVPQDPNDEPASVLLERIRAEKEELIRQGKIKRDKKESIIFRGEDNSYYLRTGNLEESLDAWQFDDLPETWEICCLGDVCDYGDCINVNTADIGEDAWILDLEDIEKDTGTVLKKVTKAQRSSVSTKHRFHSGQVLYSKLRPCLNKVVLSDDEGYCTSEILPLEFDRFVLPEYARYYLMSATFLAYADRCSYGVKMPRMGTADGKKAIFPLPPLAEQERIVKEIERYFCQLTRISEALA